MNWDNLRILIAVNRHGSIMKAAKQLQINHSTVLRRLASLESDLQLKLFKRLATGYEITPAAETLLDDAVALEKIMLTLQQKAAETTERHLGQLKVALPPGDALDLMPMLCRFSHQHPHITLSLDFDMGLKDLNKMEADVSIRFTTTPPVDYVGVEVLSFASRLYVSKGYLQQHPTMTSISDIADWILIDVAPLSNAFESWIKSINPDAHISMRLNSMEMAATAVSEGMGATFLYKHIAELRDNVVEFPCPEMDSQMGIWLLTHQDLRYQPRVKLFFDFMRKQLPLRYPDDARTDLIKQ